MLVSLSTHDYCLNSYLIDSVKHRCSVSKVYARPTLGNYRTVNVYFAGGSHMSAQPTAVMSSPWSGTLSWQARKHSEHKCTVNRS